MLKYWNLHTNPLAHTGKSEKLCEQRWFGVTLNDVSSFEYKRVKQFCKPLESWVSRVDHYEDILLVDTTDVSVWFKNKTDRDAFYAMLDTIPQRNITITVPEMTPEIKTLLHGLNYFAYEDNTLSIEDVSSTLLVHLKLLAS